MTKHYQTGFTETELKSLPLFSGTAIRVTLPPAPQPRPAGRQTCMAKCRLCLDTGRIKKGSKRYYCWCEAGLKARQGAR